MKTINEIQKAMSENNFFVELHIGGHYYCYHLNRDKTTSTVWSDSACEDADDLDNAIATAWPICEDWMSEHRAQFIKTPEEAVGYINSEDFNELELSNIIADLGWEESDNEWIFFIAGDKVAVEDDLGTVRLFDKSDFDEADYSSVDPKSDDSIIKALALFLRGGDTLETCPIKITSKTPIDGEDAQLVRFVFGNAEETCVAVVYDDGGVFTPTDWQNPVWDSEDWSIKDSPWMDYLFHSCINHNGMPRMIVNG